MDGDREYEYMKKLGQGDHKSFDALFLLYHPKVKNFLLGFIKDEEETYIYLILPVNFNAAV